jgi:hypothetical protein
MPPCGKRDGGMVVGEGAPALSLGRTGMKEDANSGGLLPCRNVDNLLGELVGVPRVVVPAFCLDV